MLLAPASLLSLALLACDPDPGDGASDTADSADTADTGDGPVDPGCALVSNRPRTTSWNGGETITLTFDCDDPGAATSLEVEVAGERVTAQLGEIDGRSLTATYPPPEVEREGIEAVLLFFGKVEVDGGDQHFRLDAHELDLRVQTDDSGVNLGLGGTLQAFEDTADGGRVTLTRQGDGSLLAHHFHDANLGPLNTYDVIQISGSLDGKAEPAWGGAWTSVDSISSNAFLSVGFDSGGPSLLQVSLGEKGLAHTRSGPSWDEAGLAKPGSGDDLRHDPSGWVIHGAKGEVLSHGMVVTGASLEDGTAVAVGLSESFEDGVSQGWAVDWQDSAQDLLHVTPRAEGSDGIGYQALLGETAIRVKGWNDAGRSRDWQYGKLIPGAEAVAATSAVRAGEKGDTLVLALLDETGAVTLIELDPAGGEPQATTLAAKSAGLTNFRRLEAGQEIFFPPLRLGTDDKGGTRLYSTVVANRFNNRSYGYRDTQTFSATWTGAISELPDHVEQIASGGVVIPEGTGSAPTSATPALIHQLGGHTQDLGAADVAGRRRPILGNSGGWYMAVDGLELVARGPLDSETRALPIDPSAPVHAELIDGDLVVFGQVLSEDADGSTTSGPGVVVAHERWKAGLGVALFNMHSVKVDEGELALASVAGSRRLQGEIGLTVDLTLNPYAELKGADGSYRGFAVLPEGVLPADGEELVVDLDVDAWPTPSEVGGLPAVWLPDGLVEAGLFDDAPLAETEGVGVLGQQAPHGLASGVVATVPTKEGCGLQTVAIPPRKDGGLDLDAAVVLATSADEDCADLPWPEAAMDPDGEGEGTVLLSRAGAEDGTRELSELVWDGELWLELPALTLPAWDALGVADLDGDRFDEVLLHVSSEPGADGLVDPALSGLLLRTGGRHTAIAIRAEVIGIKNASKAAADLPPDATAIAGVELTSEGGGSDVVVIGQTGGKNLLPLKTNQQLSAIHLVSYGTLLE